jgi:predicted N-acetyltransferase YhbS
MNVRLAREEDDAAIGALLVSAFVEAYAEKMPEVVPTERRKAELRDVAGKRAIAHVWVAEEAGAIIGTVALWPPGASGSHAFVANACDLRHLAVDRAHRGGGTVSRALLAAAEAGARGLGALAICLHVRRGATGLLRFYAAHGYERREDADIDDLPEVYLLGHIKPLA